MADKNIFYWQHTHNKYKLFTTTLIFLHNICDLRFDSLILYTCMIKVCVLPVTINQTVINVQSISQMGRLEELANL